MDLSGLGVSRLLDLVLATLGEANAEKTELVTVSGGAVNVGLDLRLPLLDDGALLVACKLHTMEVGQAGIALDLLAHETSRGLRIFRNLLDHTGTCGKSTRHRANRLG